MGVPVARRPSSISVALALVVVCALAGCTTVDSSGSGTVSAPARGALDPGFLGGAIAPSPEATINPAPGSWDDITPRAGYRVVLISAADDAAGATVVEAVSEWATAVGATVQTRTAADDDQVEELIEDAVTEAPDLVVGAGAAIVDVFTLITSQHLDQQFLVVGAQLPEPTGNVTSVIWEGASFRGTGISTPDEARATAMTTRRARDAIAAGVASVLLGYTGIVVNLP